jgi:hypothetical protein
MMIDKEVLEMTAKFAATIAVIFSAVALLLNARGLKYQKKSLRANLFNDIRRRINELEDQWAECKTSKDQEKWYERLFSIFETFAFYANHGYLEEEMADFYSTGIEICVDRLKEFPELQEYFKDRGHGEFSELDKYYSKFVKKKLPF